MEKKRERRHNSRAEIAFSRAWSLYVSILPFRIASTRKSTKMTWLGLWRGLQSPTASSPFSLTGRTAGPSLVAVTHRQERRPRIGQDRHQTRRRHGQKPRRVTWKAVGN